MPIDFWKEFERLRQTQPRLALSIVQCENSDFTNYSLQNKNCYLVTGAAKNLDCYYARTMVNCRDCIDCGDIFDSELCYDCIDCENCYNGNFLQNCKSCRDSEFLYDCIGCANCFACVSLRNQEFHIFNEPVSKEEYEERLQYFRTPEGMKEAQKKFEELKVKTPRAFARIINSENVVGDYIVNSKNCFHCFEATDTQDGIYLDRPIGTKDSVDCSNLYKNCELNYMVMSGATVQNCNYSFRLDFCHDCEYCLYCFNSSYLFGCVARNHAQYEILNKKYSKDDWHKQVAEIKDQMRREGSYGRMIESDYPPQDTLLADYYPDARAQ